MIKHAIRQNWDILIPLILHNVISFTKVNKAFVIYTTRSINEGAKLASTVKQPLIVHVGQAPHFKRVKVNLYGNG